jgi:GNAT superfamily N-acetyltransferase
VNITYALEPRLAVREFQQVLIESTLGERRPVDDLARLESMLRKSDIIATARDAGRLVGISRAISDFSFCCYLSDLAVSKHWQRKGIGKELINMTQQAAGPLAKLFLVSAPAALEYYPKLGMREYPCFGIPSKG